MRFNLTPIQTLVQRTAALGACLAAAACGGGQPGAGESDSAGATRESAQVARIIRSTPNATLLRASQTTAVAVVTPPAVAAVAVAAPSVAAAPPAATAVAFNATSTAASTQSNSGVGINLDRPSHWSTDWVLINSFPLGDGWSTQCWNSDPGCSGFVAGGSESNTKEQGRLNLDAQGWVKSLPAPTDLSVKYRRVWTTLFQGDGGARQAGRYVVLYDGQGTLEYNGAGRKIDIESRPGRDIVEVSNVNENGLILTISATNPSNYLRNIRVISPGGICTASPLVYVPNQATCPAGTYKSLEALSSVQTFHPSYLGDLRGFRTLRFMQWSNTNTSPITNWASRPKMTDAFWSSPKGMPYEAMFELSAALGADPWVNVPSDVEDEFVVNLARVAKATLAPGKLLYFEYGNEPWNYAEPYLIDGAKFEARARKKWPSATGNGLTMRMNWYAFRSVQLCKLVKAEFADQATRVKCALEGQASASAISELTMQCEYARSELGDRCSRFVDVMAIAPYFGYYVGLPIYSATVAQWTNDPDGGLDKLFRELSGRDSSGHHVTPPLYSSTSGTPADGAVASVKKWLVDNKRVADAHGLPMVAYESGQHLVAYTGGKTQTLFQNANRDPRMASLMTRHVEDWKAAGGQLFLPFSYTAKGSNFGFWGMKEHQRDDWAPKWMALKAARDQACWWAACSR